jgi:hypothetical protein
LPLPRSFSLELDFFRWFLITDLRALGQLVLMFLSFGQPSHLAGKHQNSTLQTTVTFWVFTVLPPSSFGCTGFIASLSPTSPRKDVRVCPRIQIEHVPLIPVSCVLHVGASDDELLFFLFFFYVTIHTANQKDLKTRPTQHTGDVETAEPTPVMKILHAGEAILYIFYSSPYPPSPAGNARPLLQSYRGAKHGFARGIPIRGPRQFQKDRLLQLI